MSGGQGRGSPELAVHSFFATVGPRRRQRSRRDTSWKRKILGQLIRRTTISPHPTDLARGLHIRKGESADDLAWRREVHQAEVLYKRVDIDWLF